MDEKKPSSIDFYRILSRVGISYGAYYTRSGAKSRGARILSVHLDGVPINRVLTVILHESIRHSIILYYYFYYINICRYIYGQ